jgi:DNA-binding transcriptional MerR regulator
MTKAADAFRTISEVADELDVPKHVLRFWEVKFPQIKPMKRGGGRRYYRPEDVQLLRAIHRLLHGDGYTIRGVQKKLRTDGVERVKSEAAAVEAGPAAAVIKAKAPKAPGRAQIVKAAPRDEVARIEQLRALLANLVDLRADLKASAPVQGGSQPSAA